MNSALPTHKWGPHGIHVNTLCPFYALTTMGSVRRRAPWPGRTPGGIDAPRRAPGDPELDIGRAAVFLLSDDSSYVTGQTLFVEGGRMRT